jgi:hypothetical protein
VGAVILGALALGSAASGLLATINLLAPYLAASLCMLLTLVVILTLKEPHAEEKTDRPPRKAYGAVMRESLAAMRARPGLLYPMVYLALVPVVGLIMEWLFLQPQAVALGVPLAGVGLIWTAVQFTNMAGSNWADGIKARLGEVRLLYAAPLVIAASLVLLAALQWLPALLLIGVIGFLTAVVRPLLLNRIQKEVTDDLRATLLSMQSLMFTFLLAVSQPTLGYVADHAGLPAAYVVLAGSFGVLILFLFWKSRHHFPRPAATAPA